MASISGNGSKGHHKFTLEVNETYNYVDTNKSTVEITFKLSAITAGYNWSGWGNKISYTVTVDGTNYTGTIPSYNGSSTVTLVSTSQDVPHNADGTKTVNFSFSVTDGAGQSYTCGNASASGSVNMITIPRASTMGNITGGTIGQTITLGITPAASSFTHVAYMILGSRRQDLTVASNQQSASTTIQMAYCNDITSGNSSGVSQATATMYLETYSGGTLVGQKSSTFTMTVPTSVVPTITSITTSDTTNNLSTHGAYVQGKSNFKIQIGASGAYSSSISSVTVNIKNSSTTVRTFNASWNSSTSKYEGIVNGVSNVGTFTVEVIVKDSRNRQATNSNNSITVASYSPPTITTFTAERRSNNSTVTLVWSASTHNINSHNSNAKNFYIYKRQKGSSSWGSAIYSSTNSYTYSSSGTTLTCDENYGWEFKMTAQDSYSTSEKTTEVSTVFELINWGSNGTSMAIGKVAEGSKTFEVGNQMKSKIGNGHVVTTTYGASGGNWIMGRSNLSVFNNVPADTGWHPVAGVKTQSGDWQFGALGNTNILRAVYFADSLYPNNNTYTYDLQFPTKSGTIATTGDVSGKISKSDLLSYVYPVGSIYMSANSTSPATFLGGTWQQLTGGFLYANNGYGSGNGTGTSTNSHTLTVNEIPSHQHTFNGKANKRAASGSSFYSVVYDETAALDMYINYTGGGQGHSHNIPYIAVYMWRRTA